MDAIVNQITAALLPKLKDLVAQAAEAAAPTVKEIIIEEVVPKVGLALVLGLAVVGVAAAAIGSHYATRRNPVRRRRLIAA